MKKLFILGFALFILLTVGCADEVDNTGSDDTIGGSQNQGGVNAPSGNWIFIRGLEQLEELQRIVLEYDDEEFYQRSQGRDDDFCSLTYQFGSREQAVDFLVIVDSLTIPSFPIVDKNISYTIGRKYIDIALILRECEFGEGRGEHIWLEFWFDEAIISEHFEKTADSNSLIYQNRSEGMTVYAIETDEPIENRLDFWIVYNDVPIFAIYVNHNGSNTGRGEFPIAEMMEGVSMVTVAELQETMAEQRAELAAQQEQATE